MIFPNPVRAFFAAVRTGWAKMLGYRVLTTEQEELEREHICLPCPERDKDFDQCKVCSCFIYAKIKLATEACPKKKWKRIWSKNRYAN